MFLAFNFALLVLLVFTINERRRYHEFERNASVMILSQYGVRCSVFSSKSIDEMVASLQSENFLRREYGSSFSIELTHLAPNAETISSSEQPICSITVITVISLPLNGTRKVLILVDFADEILYQQEPHWNSDKISGTGLVVRRLGGELSPPNRVVFLVLMISFWVAKTKENRHQM